MALRGGEALRRIAVIGSGATALAVLDLLVSRNDLKVSLIRLDHYLRLLLRWTWGTKLEYAILTPTTVSLAALSDRADEHVSTRC